jgi:hypothetical protein
VIGEIKHQRDTATAARLQLQFTKSSAKILRKSVQSLQNYCDYQLTRATDRMTETMEELGDFPALRGFCEQAITIGREIKVVQDRLHIAKNLNRKEDRDALNTKVKSCGRIVENIEKELGKLLDGLRR